MNGSKHNEIVSFIWSIADDVLRDVFNRGKYRDVILPFTVIRRIDALLEPTKQDVLDTYKFLKKEGVDNFDGLTKETGYPFYNISEFTLSSLLNDPDHIDSNLEKYLDGFDPFVQEIISKFKIRNHLETLQDAGITYALIEKFTSKKINLSPNESTNEKGEKIEGLSNLGMGYVFEELVRKFNEENNEEAGEHFTPRDIIKLMTEVVFDPVQDQLKTDASYLIYDPACGTGGMLTEAQDYLEKFLDNNVTTYLYGQEIQPETYAICTADMLIKGDDPANIYYGSTLTDSGFSHLKFDFMLTNPPYGKSWKKDKEKIEVRGKITDPRFVHGTPRSSDGQLLFISDMVSKMRHDTDLGSRIASVHNGSALFTGSAGQGESDIRKWIIENDYLETIIALPERMFYNTGIATYILILTNRKSEERKGKIQLIDATDMYSELRKNLGEKSRELKPSQIKELLKLFNDFKETEKSMIFDNKDFGYQEITVERPLRSKAQLSDELIEKIRFNVRYVEEIMEWMFGKFGEEVYKDPKQFKKQVEAYMESNGIDIKATYTKKLYQKSTWEDQLKLLEVAKKVQSKLSSSVYSDFNQFVKEFDQALNDLDIKLSSKEKNEILGVVSWKDEEAEKVIKKTEKDGTVVYEVDSDLRDTENVPLKEDIEEYFAREVLPYVPDAWIDKSKTKIGYEINFNKYFYKYEPLRDLDEIRADILKIEEETDGLLNKILED
ncbi:MAG TPA: class I SAM-dependent DNA methyltransferase [Candidatus Woesebacteria bacterium]|nr:class I SAM-dependent DNA methyltransferase [Candidatus Woesebacteria bacterium]